jgi:hypothetical protein
MVSTARAFVLSAVVLAVVATHATTQAQGTTRITAPKQQFGANIGDDYFLTNYTQFEQYWKVLDRESDRMQLVDIGKTEEGRTQWMAIITAPENFRRLDRYKEISRRLAQAEGLTDEQARALAAEGKAVVWIDGGLHATEVLGAAADRNRLPAREPYRRRDAALPARHDRPCGARKSGRHGTRVQLVHA